MNDGFFQPYEYDLFRNEYVDGLLRERDALRLQLKTAKTIIEDMIHESMLQDSFEDDEGKQIMENAHKFLDDMA